MVTLRGPRRKRRVCWQSDPCSHCGAVTGAFALDCPNCGHELTIVNGESDVRINGERSGASSIAKVGGDGEAHAVTLNEIADEVDRIAIKMANALMPAADDPDRARQAYALGIASHAVIERAAQLRKLTETAAYRGLEPLDPRD